jgi:hypothetical protein
MPTSGKHPLAQHYSTLRRVNNIQTVGSLVGNKKENKNTGQDERILPQFVLLFLPFVRVIVGIK